MRTNKTFWIAVLLFSSIGQVRPQPPDTVWTYVYGGSGQDEAYAISPTSDGGFVVGGSTGLPDPDHAMLIRLDSEGHEVWIREYDDLHLFLMAGTVTQDGGFAMTGRYGSSLLVVKTDSMGTVEWSASPIWSLDGGIALVETSDSGLAVLAAGDGKRLVRFDSSGDTLWTRSFAESPGWFEGSLVVTPDNGFFLASSLSRQVYVVKTDSSGFEEWSAVFGNNELSETIHSASLTADGDYIVAGAQARDASGWTTNPFAARIASTGDTIWTRVYGGLGLARFYSVCALPDGDIVLGGGTSSGYLLAKCDPDGNIVWSALYGAPMSTYGPAMCLAQDGGLAMAGYRHSLGSSEDIFVIRTASVLHGNPAPSVSPLSFTLLPNYPNPFNSTTTIDYDVTKTGLVTLQVFDILGREVATLVRATLPAGFYSTIWTAASLPSGVYLCRMEAPDFVQTRTMVLVK